MDLKEAKQILSDNWEEGVVCPCCSQLVKLYERPLHTTMALTLIRLYKLDINSSDDYFHVKEIVKGISDTGTNDFSKLKYWGLIIEMPKEDNVNKRTSGYWKISPKGIEFVIGAIKVRRSVKIFNKKSYGFTGPEISIKEALGSKFDYKELMGFKY